MTEKVYRFLLQIWYLVLIKQLFIIKQGDGKTGKR